MKLKLLMLICVAFTVQFSLSELRAIAQSKSAENNNSSLPSETSDGAMNGVNLQRTGVYLTDGVPQINGLLWKSEKIFEIRNLPMTKTDFDGSGTTTNVGFSNPIYSDNALYFTVFNGDGYLLALNSTDGTGKWKFKLKGTRLSAPAVVGKRIYVMATDGNMRAVDVATGEEVWKFDTKERGESISSPLVASGVVYFVGGRGNLFAVDVKSSQSKWVYKTKGATTPALSEGTLYFSSQGQVYAVDIASGRELWRFKAGRYAETPSVAGGTVFCKADEEHLYALDAKNGQVRWNTKLPTKSDSFVFLYFGITLTTPIAADNGLVYTGGGYEFYAFDATTGQLKWTYKFSVNKEDAKIGPFQWQPAINKFSCTSPVIAKGIIYFSSIGKIYALDAVSGQERWTLKTPQSLVSSLSLADGKAFVVSNNGLAYALK